MLTLNLRSWRHALCALVCALPCFSAMGVELRQLRTDPAQPAVGQPFRVIFEPKFGWSESSACNFHIEVDGRPAERDDYQANLDVTPDAAALWKTHTYGVRQQRWSRDGKQVQFDWTFYTPGPHTLAFSRCGLDAPAVLRVDVAPDHRALNWTVIGRKGEVLTTKLDGSPSAAKAGVGLTLIASKQHADAWRRAFQELDPKAWERAHEAINGILKQLGFSGSRLHLVDDLEPWTERSGRDELVLVPGNMPELRERLLRSGAYVAAASMDADKVASAYAKHLRDQAEGAQQEAQLASERWVRFMDRLPAAASQIIALKRAPAKSEKARVCARRATDGTWITAYRHWPSFVAWSGRAASAGFDEVLTDLDALYMSFKTGPCSAVVVTGADAQAMAQALQRDGVAFEVLELLDQEALMEPLRLYKGYATLDDARLSRQLHPPPEAKELVALRAAGIQSQALAEQAWARLAAQSYSPKRDWDTLVQFVADEATARQQGGQALAVKNQREAKARAQAAADRERLLKAYPYQLALECHNGPYGTLPVHVCFNNDRSQGQLDLVNCGKSRTITYEELAGNVAQFGLCPRFQFKARNVSEFVLKAVLRDERTGKELESQSASRFRWVGLTR